MLDSKLIELEAFLREHVDDDDANTVKETMAEIVRLRALVMLGDFSSLRPNSESFKLVQQIRREQSTGEQSNKP